MTCREYLPLINDLTDGYLNGISEKKVRSHLTDCRECSEKFQSTKRLKSLLKKYSKPDPGRKYFRDATSQILKRIPGTSNTVYAVN